MTTRQVFIRNREFIPDVSQITGVSIIELEYEFDKAAIHRKVCMLDIDLTAEQAAEIDRKAKVARENRMREAK